jgi:hypothetical protein
MAAPVKKNNNGQGRSAIIKGIDNPLGFFVLALLIVEAFLTLVLTYADIKDEVKPTFIWIGCILFIIVVVMVCLLVWFKPENLTFDRNAHLNRGKEQFGSDQQKISPEKRFGNQTTPD